MVILINAITELAMMLKDRENGMPYAPLFGTIIELPDLKIRLSDKIILTKIHIKSCINLYHTDNEGRYVLLNKELVLLPYANYQKYVVVGTVI